MIRMPKKPPLFETTEILAAINAGMASLALDEFQGPWDGPNVEWTCGSLAATTPPPQVALDPEYLEDNDIEVDEDYLLVLLWQIGIEQGYRMGRYDAAMAEWVQR